MSTKSLGYKKYRWQHFLKFLFAALVFLPMVIVLTVSAVTTDETTVVAKVVALIWGCAFAYLAILFAAATFNSFLGRKVQYLISIGEVVTLGVNNASDFS